MLTPTVLILAAIDRLLLSSQNINTRLYNSRRLAYFSVGIATGFWLLFSLHALIKVDVQHFGPTNSFCYYDLEKTYQLFVSYSLMLFNTVFCSTLIALSAVSFKNVRRIRAIPRQQRTRAHAMNKKDFQLLRCLFTQVIVYIICSVIPSGYSIYDIVTKYQNRTPLQDALHNVMLNMSIVLYFSYHGTNIFVFIAISKAFRHELKRYGHQLVGRDPIALRAEDQQQSKPKSNFLGSS
jgi:hypothetical protein